MIIGGYILPFITNKSKEIEYRLFYNRTTFQIHILRSLIIIRFIVAEGIYNKVSTGLPINNTKGV
jgi:hypothetical protein